MGTTVPALQRPVLGLGVWLAVWTLGESDAHESDVAIANFRTRIYAGTFPGPDDSVDRRAKTLGRFRRKHLLTNFTEYFGQIGDARIVIYGHLDMV